MEWISSIIVGIMTLTGTVISVVVSNNKTKAIMNYEINDLKEEVRKHNGLIDRMYKCEARLDVLEKK